jgi:hypothetical protein
MLPAFSSALAYALRCSRVIVDFFDGVGAIGP